jgi:quercetin dioxygenase-like cupin family protein
MRAARATHAVMRGDDFRRRLNAGGPAVQRTNISLLGGEDTEKCFVGTFKRANCGEIETAPWRYHDAEEVEYIIDGQLRVQLRGEDDDTVTEFVAVAGDLFYIGAGVRHRAAPVGDGVCRGLVFCPEPYSTASGQTSLSDQ